MPFDLSRETHEFHRMVAAFLQRLPHLLLALVVFLLFYLAGKAIRSVVARVSHRQSKHAYLSAVLGRFLFHDQTEETDGDRSRQREGWPAGKGEVPRPREVRKDGGGKGDDVGNGRPARTEG
jgi:hypothetical protein